MQIDRVIKQADTDTRLKQFIAHKRLRLFHQIHEIVFYGNGGYSFETVYSLPIWLRNYIYKEIVEYYKREAEQAEAAKDGGNTQTLKNPKIPPQAFQKKPDVKVKRPKVS